MKRKHSCTAKAGPPHKGVFSMHWFLAGCHFDWSILFCALKCTVRQSICWNTLLLTDMCSLGKNNGVLPAKPLSFHFWTVWPGQVTLLTIYIVLGFIAARKEHQPFLLTNDYSPGTCLVKWSQTLFYEGFLHWDFLFVVVVVAPKQKGLMFFNPYLMYTICGYGLLMPEHAFVCRVRKHQDTHSQAVYGQTFQTRNTHVNDVKILRSLRHWILH